MVLRPAVRPETVDLVIGEVVVLVFDERHLVIVGRFQIVLLGEVDPDLVRRRSGGCVDILDVLIGHQGRIVDYGVEFRRFVGLSLKSVFGIGRNDRFFFFRIIVGNDGASPHAPIAQRFFWIKLRTTLGANGRAAAEIIEFR